MSKYFFGIAPPSPERVRREVERALRVRVMSLQVSSKSIILDLERDLTSREQRRLLALLKKFLPRADRVEKLG